MAELRKGNPRIQVLRDILRSATDTESLNAPLDTPLSRRIRRELVAFKLSRLPLLGGLLRRLLDSESALPLDRSLRTIEFRLQELAQGPEISSVNAADSARTESASKESALAAPVSSGETAIPTVDPAHSSPNSPVDEPRYWIPQGLRDFILDFFGERHVPTFTYWMSLVDEFGESFDNFEKSSRFGELCTRIRELAVARSPVGKPAVTIIIPVHNALVYTLTCIASILEFPGQQSFEILVGDDKSSDGTASALGLIGGNVRVLSHQKNLGFLKNCNVTALRARGEIVVFLNNDTLVLPGWLDALCEPLKSPEIGLSGSKLINPDGSLQEAGGIVWKDGSAWNFGRGKDPRRPEFNYRKEVDYISGASIALRTATWRDLDGFDPIYSPAYCEDCDLAFRLREKGLKVIYQPHSAVIHHEGRSHGRDTSTGIKAYQVANTAKLLERWRSTFSRDLLPNGEEVFVARDRSRAKPHILFVDHYVPQWDRDAGSRSMLHYLQLFSDAGFQVTLWPDNLHEDIEYTRQLQSMGIEVIYSGAYAGQFDSWLRENTRWIDYVFLSRPHISIKYIDAVKSSSSAKILYYGHDLHFLRSVKEFLITRNDECLRAAMTVCRFELEVCQSVDAILYPSVDERDILKAVLGGSDRAIAAIPVYLLSEAELSAAEQRTTKFHRRTERELLFVGGFAHSPNVDGLKWFVAEVMPFLLSDMPDLHLSVAGSNPPDSILSLASRNVSILGRVTDERLAELYREASIAIVPLRYGAGVKGKLIEALAAGLPIVTTAVGVQGIVGWQEFVFLGDTPREFAEAILSAESERDSAHRKVVAGVDFLRRNYSSRAAMKILAPYVPQFDARLKSMDSP
jgi:GT2 family glycosyltransferase